MSPIELILMNRNDAARALGISIRSLGMLVRKGHLPAVRVGKRVLFLRETLVKFAQSREVGPNGELVK